MASRLFPYVAAIGVVLVFASPALATWSVIAVDQKAREVAIASATCVPQGVFAGFPARGLMDVQAIVVPGKGVAAVQAGVDRTRKNPQLAFDEIAKGIEPATILEMPKADPNVESRQFAMVDLQGRMVGFSGPKNLAQSLSRQQQVPGTGICFSIQGNLLAATGLIRPAENANPVKTLRLRYDAWKKAHPR